MSQLSEFSLGDKLIPKGAIQTVGIVGCGEVGQELTIMITKSGIDVVFIDVDEDRINEIFQQIESRLDRIIQHWGITASEKRLIQSRITGSIHFSSLAKCQIVIETISSRKSGTMIEMRKSVFQQIEKEVSPETLISSNLSTLMISDLAAVLRKPNRAIGMHFIEPIDKTQIVEVVRGQASSDLAYETASRFCNMINKKVIHVNESPGNISTRMIIPMINEACELLMEGVASIQDIDETMREAAGNNAGPFELADRIGLDKILKYMDNLYAEYGEKKYKASPIIKRLVRANYLGRHVGKGFYDYKSGKPVGNTITCSIIK
ncbi:MAG: 3-hydroxyacyl-CoA dehydrogenase NAD-binding domain-containing protein [Bacteroidales bacterium]|jgi:3-hydroxybutyryl-CoA dehydrogenase